MSTIAAKVAAHKRANPTLYCHRCLWKTVTKSGPSPCPRHSIRPLGAAHPWQPNTFDLLENAEKRRAQHAAMWPVPPITTPEAFKAALLAALPAPRPPVCEQCGDPATCLVDQNAARFHGFRCESCAPLVVAAFARRGLTATIARLVKRGGAV